MFTNLLTISIYLSVMFQSSVEEARYMLASRRGSFPCTGRGMRRKSLDMVAEEQSTDSTQGDNTMTSLVSLRVPRHRNRSRSLDNSLETRNSFAAFKESLKVRSRVTTITRESKKINSFESLIFLCSDLDFIVFIACGVLNS